jgi:hypothetical protein
MFTINLVIYNFYKIHLYIEIKLYSFFFFFFKFLMVTTYKHKSIIYEEVLCFQVVTTYNCNFKKMKNN